MTTDNFCFYLQNTLIQTSQTGGQQYNDPSPFSIPWFQPHLQTLDQGPAFFKTTFLFPWQPFLTCSICLVGSISICQYQNQRKRYSERYSLFVWSAGNEEKTFITFSTELNATKLLFCNLQMI
jgi:hypothetical protein